MEQKPITAPRSLGRQLNFAAGASSAVCNHMLEPHGLSLAQWAVLSSLWRNGPLSLKDIAGLTGNSPPATSKIVDRMVTGGLLERQQDAEDRRAVTITLSTRGEELRPLSTFFETINQVLLEGFSEVEEQTLFDLLARAERNARTWLERKESR